MQSVLVIVNTHAGKQTGIDVFQQIAPLFAEKHMTLHRIDTEYAGHIHDTVLHANLSLYHAIIAIGGDGSLHELVNGLLQRPDKQTLPLALIPAGTGNAFVKDLTHNVLDPIKMAEAIIKQHIKAIDVIHVETADKTFYSVNMLGIGLAADVSQFAENYRWLGAQRYNIGSLVEVIKNTHRQVTLSYTDHNNQTHHRSGYYDMTMLCNNRYTGNGMLIAPKAIINDGLVDVLLLQKTNRLRLLQLFSQLFKGQHIQANEVEYIHAKACTVATPNRQALTVDGEMMGHTPITATVLPKAIQLLGFS